MMGDEARITYWNHAAEQIFGYTEEEAIGRDLHKTIVPERFHDDFLKGVEVFIETGQGNVIGKSALSENLVMVKLSILSSNVFVSVASNQKPWK